MEGFLRRAVAQGMLRAVDLHFARQMETLAGGNAPELLLAAALASHRVGEGDVCLDLERCRELPLLHGDGGTDRPRVPAPEVWVDALGARAVVGKPGGRAPLILDRHGRLYLGRYWWFERQVADAVIARVRSPPPAVDRDRLRVGLRRLFPGTGGIDWQRVAAAVAVLRHLCLISGGPGTGKTRTVTAILALLTEQTAGPPLRIALAAPTGKATARLSESIRTAKAGLSVTEQTSDRIPEEAVTLHRLLGYRPGHATPRHGADNPLHLEVLVVDEASMVDLPLMARLLAALPDCARLILLGDKDQLASVEAGRVLGDLCGRGRAPGYSPGLCAEIAAVAGDRLAPAPAPGPDLGDRILVLRESWRFGKDSGIGALARAVNRGDADAGLQILADDRYPDVGLEAPRPQILTDLIEQWLVPVMGRVLTSPEPQAALLALDRVRVLCALRSGPQGVDHLNERLAQALEAAGLIRRDGELYAGRPIMLTANDHALRLYNGDVGLVLADPGSGGALRVFFATAAGVRRILPSRLPAHETVYAMTVHKSQGSEFDEVLLVLPETESRVLTRELIYTGITRARKRVRLLATEERLRAAIARPLVRASGLYDALWTRPGADDPGPGSHSAGGDSSESAPTSCRR
ncbi:exodeoxyribonuclease V subunit alpha [Candidatus Thiosymbion oneisti]|uniref:exodeoxyribonuclease V subunit alpha n=1 Tax=Candidatus Thiosymbion oneisti TaxID=589554 RepID=UPI000B2D3284|nr:exodeoxyribonuclease V subunit alpha [Candidatus Thiosymbion oneisti]